MILLALKNVGLEVKVKKIDQIFKSNQDSAEKTNDIKLSNKFNKNIKVSNIWEG